MGMSVHLWLYCILLYTLHMMRRELEWDSWKSTDIMWYIIVRIIIASRKSQQATTCQIRRTLTVPTTLRNKDQAKHSALLHTQDSHMNWAHLWTTRQKHEQHLSLLPSRWHYFLLRCATTTSTSLVGVLCSVHQTITIERIKKIASTDNRQKWCVDRRAIILFDYELSPLKRGR